MSNSISAIPFMLNLVDSKSEYQSPYSKQESKKESFDEMLSKHFPSRSNKSVLTRDSVKDSIRKDYEIRQNSKDTSRYEVKDKNKEIGSLSNDSSKANQKKEVSIEYTEENKEGQTTEDFTEDGDIIAELQVLKAALIDVLGTFTESSEDTSSSEATKSLLSQESVLLGLEDLTNKAEQIIESAKNMDTETLSQDNFKNLLAQFEEVFDNGLINIKDEAVLSKDLVNMAESIINRIKELPVVSKALLLDTKNPNKNNLSDVSISATDDNQILDESLTQTITAKEDSNADAGDTSNGRENSIFRIVGSNSPMEFNSSQEDFINLFHQGEGKVEVALGDSIKYSIANKSELDQFRLEKDNILAQIIDSAKVKLGKGESEIKIKLKPEILGEMSLKVVLEKGIVTAKVAVENQQVKQLIESNLLHLRENLREQGLEIHSFEVFTGSDPNPHNHQRRHWNNEQIKKKSKISIALDELNQTYEDYTLNKDYGIYPTNTGIDFMA